MSLLFMMEEKEDGKEKDTAGSITDYIRIL